MDFDKDPTLQEWTREQPLSVLALDSADRAVLRIADERDAVQKKTFTKWVNKHLKKVRSVHVFSTILGSGNVAGFFDVRQRKRIFGFGE
jgi:hypothetical protein